MRAACAGRFELKLELGAELRVDSDLLRDLDRGERGGVLALAGSSTLLVEFEPYGVGPEPLAFVGELVARGYRPLVAHPELTPFLAHEPSTVEGLAAAGAVLQLTAASLTGELGRAARDRAHGFVERELPCVVASDAHRPHWRPPGLARAQLELERRFGAAIAKRATAELPARLLEPRAADGDALEATA